MVDYFSHRKDAIEEQTDRLHDEAEAELRAGLEAKYIEDFGAEYAAVHPFKIYDGAAFERQVIAHMREQAKARS